MNADDRWGCPGSAEILADLAEEDLLQLQPGERLWKLYCFRASGHATGLRHRIYTKIKDERRLALVTFAVHNPPPDNDGAEAGGPDEDGVNPVRVRSGIARVADLSANDLDRVIAAMRKSNAAKYEELDLSDFETLEDQLAWLRENA